MNTFRVWKTIKLGTGLQTAQDFITAIRNVKKDPWGGGIAKWDVTNIACKILDSQEFIVSKVEIEVDLVAITPEELGFTNFVTFKQIFTRAIERGLEPCFAEVGPQLRLQYYEGDRTNSLFIGMEPIDIGGKSAVFEIGHTDIVWSRGLQNEYLLSGSTIDHKFSEGLIWIFVKPRS